MPTTTVPDLLRKGDRVVAAVDLRDVPAGTTGKVAIVEGLSWIRYWVRFSNGVSIGSINRAHLMTPYEWEHKDERAAAAVADGAAADGADDGGGAAAGGGVSVNGALVPQMLLDRSAAARARLGK